MEQVGIRGANGHVAPCFFLGCACSSRFFHAVCMNEVFFFCNSGFPIVASRLAKRGLAFQGFFCLTACRSGDFFDRSLLRVNFCVLVLSAFWTPHAGTVTQFRTPWWWKENRRTEAWLEPWSWEGAQKRLFRRLTLPHGGGSKNSAPRKEPVEYAQGALRTR